MLFDLALFDVFVVQSYVDCILTFDLQAVWTKSEVRCVNHDQSRFRSLLNRIFDLHPNIRSQITRLFLVIFLWCTQLLRIGPQALRLHNLNVLSAFNGGVNLIERRHFLLLIHTANLALFKFYLSLQLIISESHQVLWLHDVV